MDDFDPNAILEATAAPETAKTATEDPNAILEATAAPGPEEHGKRLMAHAHDYYLQNAEKFWGPGSPTYAVERVPLLNTDQAIDYYSRLHGAAKNIEAGNAGDEDYYKIAQHQAREEYESKLPPGRRYLDLLSHLPAMGAEWAATGGVGEVARIAARKVAAKYIGESILKTGARKLATKAGEAAVGALAEGAARMPLMPSTYGAMAGQLVGTDEQGQPQAQSVPGAVAKGAISSVVQNTLFAAAGTFAPKKAGGNYLLESAKSTLPAMAAVQAGKEAIYGLALGGNKSDIHELLTGPNRARAMEQLGVEGLAFLTLEGFLHAVPRIRDRYVRARQTGMSDQAAQAQATAEASRLASLREGVRHEEPQGPAPGYESEAPAPRDGIPEMAPPPPEAAAAAAAPATAATAPAPAPATAAAPAAPAEGPPVAGTVLPTGERMVDTPRGPLPESVARKMGYRVPAPEGEAAPATARGKANALEAQYQDQARNLADQGMKPPQINKKLEPLARQLDQARVAAAAEEAAARPKAPAAEPATVQEEAQGPQPGYEPAAQSPVERFRALQDTYMQEVQRLGRGGLSPEGINRRLAPLLTEIARAQKEAAQPSLLERMKQKGQVEQQAQGNVGPAGRRFGPGEAEGEPKLSPVEALASAREEAGKAAPVEPAKPGEDEFRAHGVTPLEQYVYEAIRADPEDANASRRLVSDPMVVKLFGRQPSHTSILNWARRANEKMGGRGTLHSWLKQQEGAEAVASGKVTEPGQLPFDPTKTGHFRAAQSEAEFKSDRLTRLANKMMREERSGQLTPERAEWFKRKALEIHHGPGQPSPAEGAAPAGVPGEAAAPAPAAPEGGAEAAAPASAAAPVAPGERLRRGNAERADPTFFQAARAAGLDVDTLHQLQREEVATEKAGNQAREEVRRDALEALKEFRQSASSVRAAEESDQVKGLDDVASQIGADRIMACRQRGDPDDPTQVLFGVLKEGTRKVSQEAAYERARERLVDSAENDLKEEADHAKEAALRAGQSTPDAAEALRSGQADGLLGEAQGDEVRAGDAAERGPGPDASFDFGANAPSGGGPGSEPGLIGRIGGAISRFHGEEAGGIDTRNASRRFQELLARTRAGLEDLKERFDRGETIRADEVFDTAELDSKERHVLSERSKGRALVQIASDPEVRKEDGKSPSIDGLRWLDERARRKLGDATPLLAAAIDERDPAALANLRKRFDRGEEVKLEDVFDAVGLDEKERHVVQERLKGRSFGDIGTDPELGGDLKRGSVEFLEKKASEKLGMTQSIAKTVHDEQKLDRALEKIAQGKGVVPSDVHQDPETTVLVGKAKQTKQEAITQNLEDLADQVLLEAKNGTLTPERITSLGEEADRVHQGKSRREQIEGGEAEEVSRRLRAKARRGSVRRAINRFLGEESGAFNPFWEDWARGERPAPDVAPRASTPEEPAEGTARTPPPGASWTRKFADWLKEAAGQQFPATTRLARPTGEALARAANSKEAAKADWNYWQNKLEIGGKKMRDWTTEEDRLFHATFLERRMRYYRHWLTSHGQDASGVATLVGAEGSPLATEADYTRVRDQMMPFFEAYPETFGKYADANFRGIKGLDPEDEIKGKSQMPGLPIHAEAIQEGQAPGGPGPGTGKDMRGLRVRRPGMMRPAELGADAYHLSLKDSIKHMIDQGVPASRRAEAVRAGLESGVLEDVRAGRKPTEGYRDIALRPARGLSGLDPNAQYWAHPDAYNEYIKGLEIGERAGGLASGARPFTDRLYTFTLQSPVELFSHIGNHVTSLFQEGMGVPIWNIGKSISNAWKVLTSDVGMLDRVRDLARIGASHEHEARPGLVGKTLLDPTYALGKLTTGFIDVMQKAVRVQLDDAYTKLVTSGKAQNTETGRRDFINQALGNYNANASNRVQQFLKDTGIQGFATAAWTFTAQGIKKAALGTPNAPATSLKANLEMRATMYAKLASVLGAGVAANLYLWGKAFPDDVPSFAIKTSEDRNKVYYFDPLAFTGLRRGWRATGMNAGVEAVTKVGMSFQEGREKTYRDLQHTAEHLYSGPPVQFAHTATTGENFFGRKVAVQARPGDRLSQRERNLIAAAQGINPLVASFTGADKPKTPRTLAESLVSSAGPFGTKSREKRRIGLR